MGKSRKLKRVDKENLSSNKKTIRKEVSAVQYSEFSGPIPPPHILNQYSEDVRAFIIDAASNEQRHRHNLEARITNTDSKAIMIGSYTASFVCIISIIGGLILVAIGKDGIGIATILAPVAMKGLQYLFSFNKGKDKSPDKGSSSGQPKKKSS